MHNTSGTLVSETIIEEEKALRRTQTATGSSWQQHQHQPAVGQNTHTHTDTKWAKQSAENEKTKSNGKRMTIQTGVARLARSRQARLSVRLDGDSMPQELTHIYLHTQTHRHTGNWQLATRVQKRTPTIGRVSFKACPGPGLSLPLPPSVSLLLARPLPTPLPPTPTLTLLFTRTHHFLTNWQNWHNEYVTQSAKPQGTPSPPSAPLHFVPLFSHTLLDPYPSMLCAPNKHAR